jgi:hypothetical protein
VKDAMLVGFDPNALLSVSKLAEAAYAANPIPELSPSNFKVVGGSIYANSPGRTDEQPRPVRQDGGQLVLYQSDDPKESASASLPSNVKR